MIKILIGGSPCTYWSIAQKNNRETEAEGLGWELFKNYLIAKEKFKPNLFLYENNKSAAQAIKDSIKKELGVWDGIFMMQDTGTRYIEINSALVSAQNRQRFYVHNCGEVGQPRDRGILLRNILETGISDKEKAYCLKGHPGDTRDYFKKHHNQIALEPVKTLSEKEMDYMVRETKDGRNHFDYDYAHNATKDKSQCILANISKGVPYNVLIEPCASDAVGVGYRNRREDDGKLYRRFETHGEQKANAITTVTTDSMIANPVRIGDIGSNSQAHRVYSCDGKSVNLVANGGGQGAKTGLYACPVECQMEALEIKEATKQGYTEILPPGDCVDLTQPNSKTRRGRNMKNKSNCIMTSCQYYQYCGTINAPIYQVKDGMITVKDKQYPIKLIDGYYIIRKLTVKECCRLQTMPDDYCRAVSDSQGYKGLGNGWTAEVIIHILNEALKDIPRDEEIVVLSMYDGIGTGRYCLDKMGYTNIRYYAYEIDKYAMQVAMSNYPDIMQMGDAFKLREDDWKLPEASNF